MVVLFNMCDLLALISSPTTPVSMSNSTALSENNNNNNNDWNASVAALTPSTFETDDDWSLEEARSLTLQLVFFACITITLCSAFALAGNAVVQIIRAGAKKKQMEIIRKQVEAELFGEDEAQKRAKKKIQDEQKIAEFSFVERVLIFPTWAMVQIVKRSVKLAASSQRKLEAIVHAHHNDKEAKDGAERTEMKLSEKLMALHLRKPGNILFMFSFSFVYFFFRIILGIDVLLPYMKFYPWYLLFLRAHVLIFYFLFQKYFKKYSCQTSSLFFLSENGLLRQVH